MNSTRSILWIARGIFTKIQWRTHFFKALQILVGAAWPPQVPQDDFYLIRRSPAVLLREMQDVMKGS